MTVSEKIRLSERISGKGHSKKLRKEKKVPAVIYGPNTKNQNVVIDELFVIKHSNRKHESSIFETQSDQSSLNSLKVMLKKIQNHPLSGRPIHVDLYAPDMKARIRVNVSLKFVGEPIGVKESGGIRQITMGQVEVQCQPDNIPKEIEVDISSLKVGQSMHLSEVKFPQEITVLSPLERTIVTINHPKKEKVEESQPTEETEKTEETADDNKKGQTKK